MHVAPLNSPNRETEGPSSLEGHSAKARPHAVRRCVPNAVGGMWVEESSLELSARRTGRQELHAHARCEKTVGIHRLSVSVEGCLLRMGEDGASAAVPEGFDKAALSLAEAEQLAKVGLGAQLIDPILLHLLHVALPTLLRLREIGKGHHLDYHPGAWCDRRQSRHVLHCDESELRRQVPHKLLAASAGQLHVSQIVERPESILWLEVERTSKGSRGPI
mmetsp:Transcript_129951/g.417093  ORF Transcript_129951/g.417093 Transcript_129951/m.417093 type:complete len:219 (+) Transcript_129951:85-741(+)